MKKIIVKGIIVVSVMYVIACGVLYFWQERLIFRPHKLDPNYTFQFELPFEELNIKTEDGETMNGLLFKSDSAHGLIFYLHGNGGSVASWGTVAKAYTDLRYDVFFIDYRGYGKSSGTIQSQAQLFHDNQTAYDVLKTRYAEDKIIVLGYSIGTGLAAHLASENNPRLLILQAPYYNLTEIMRERFPLIPKFILEYKFATNEYLKNCKMPIVIFHGDEDEVIKHSSSLRLKSDFSQINLISLPGQGHNGISDNDMYRAELKKLLDK
jgi:pimeloyl-ACP methyl ester carboxylesterase